VDEFPLAVALGRLSTINWILSLVGHIMTVLQFSTGGFS